MFVCSSSNLRTFNFSDSFFEETVASHSNEPHNESTSETLPAIVKSREKDSRELLIMHLNVNSLQNKIEEMGSLIGEFKAQVMFLTETKIDASYPNSQFNINGYNIYRNDL